MTPQPPPSDESILAALLTAALGSIAAVYQDAAIVLVGAVFGGLLSLQRAPARQWWVGLWHLTQCLGLALLVTNLGATIVLAEMSARWPVGRHDVMAAVAVALAWAWPDRLGAAGEWAAGQIRQWLERRNGGST